MRVPSIQKSAALSALLHLSFLVLSVVLIKNSGTVVMPSPYTVTLVNPEEVSRTGAPALPEADLAPPQTGEPAKDATAITETDKTTEKMRVEDRISEIASKKKIERIVRLRSVLSVKSSGAKTADGPAEKKSNAPAAAGSLFDNYYAKITEEIRQEWAYPDMGKKGLESVVSLIIRRDGTITINGFEKSSGDLLFDRSVLKAVSKASPVSPPPYEMEIGVRFYP